MNQLQSEALIHLMLAARYADKKLSLIETDDFQKQVDKLPWNSGTGQSLFIQQATATVRKALATDETTQELLQAKCAPFTDSQSKLDAFRHIESLLLVDGMDPKESDFLTQLKSILKT